MTHRTEHIKQAELLLLESAEQDNHEACVELLLEALVQAVIAVAKRPFNDRQWE